MARANGAESTRPNWPIVVLLTTAGVVVLMIGWNWQSTHGYWSSIAGNTGVSFLVFAALSSVEPRLVRAVRNASRSSDEISQALQRYLTSSAAAPETARPETLVRTTVNEHVQRLGLSVVDTQGEGASSRQAVYVGRPQDTRVRWQVLWTPDWIEQVVSVSGDEVARARTSVRDQAETQAQAQLRLDCESLDRALARHLDV